MKKDFKSLLTKKKAKLTNLCTWFVLKILVLNILQGKYASLLKLRDFINNHLFFLFVFDYLLLNIYFDIKLPTNNLFKYFININTILGFILN